MSVSARLLPDWRIYERSERAGGGRDISSVPPRYRDWRASHAPGTKRVGTLRRHVTLGGLCSDAFVCMNSRSAFSEDREEKDRRGRDEKLLI